MIGMFRSAGLEKATTGEQSCSDRVAADARCDLDIVEPRQMRSRLLKMMKEPTSL
jgi:hypothetical protein